MGIDRVVLARFLLTGIALLLAFLAATTWNRRKDAPEATIFAILVASMAVYAFGYAGEVAQTTVASAKFWLDVEYLALPWAGALWVLAACRHNGLRGRAPLLFVIPVITFIGHYTNFRNLFYLAPMTLIHRGPFWVLEFQRGPLSILDNAFLLVSFLAGTWVYISGLRHASSLFRKQAVVLVAASFLPLIGYLVYLAGLSPWGLDTAPVTLGVTCALLYYGIFHCGMFDLAPQARNLIFNTIRDAVIILDSRNRLLDFNPAAKALLPVLSKKNLGTEVASMLAAYPELSIALSNTANEVEIQIGKTGPETFELRTWPLSTVPSNSASRIIGRAVILANISAQVHLREELRRQSETDSLTGIANRRRFHQALEIECMRFTRGHSPLSVLMIDLDYFKNVNDQFGHPTGDAVLRSVAQMLVSLLRKTDLPARYGGEEFSVLLPETRCEGACIIAERIRQTICKGPIEVDGRQIPLSVSVGVASHANDLEVKPEILLKKADLALYRAKATGRNRVEFL
jgi:diguanylate cyclase (GGDEF)-like protein